MAYHDEVLADNPVGYWRLGEASGTVANDETANNNDGTYTGSPTLGVGGAISGNTAVDFAGGDYVALGSPAALKIAAPLSVEAWVYRTGSAGITGIVTEGFEGDSNIRYALGISDPTANRVTFGFYSGGWKRIVDPSDLTLNEWTHFVGTYDGSNLRLYRNGVEVVSSAETTSIPAGNENFYISKRWDSGTSFEGRVDEVAIYDTALSSTRVEAHYDASLVASDARVTKQYVETVAFGTASDARVTKQYTEVVAFGTASDARTTKQYIEVVSGNDLTDPSPAIDTVGSGCPGDTVTLTGSDFGNTAGTIDVTDDEANTQAATIVNWADTQVTFVIPLGLSVGTGSVLLTTAGSDTDTAAISIVPCTPPAEVVPDPGGRRLGCGDYELYIQTQGGADIVAILPFGDLAWGRRLDATSDARATAGLEGCDPKLALIEPWVHELSIRRDGIEEWVGPLYKVLWRQQTVEVSALDLSAWFDRRWMPFDRTMRADLATIASQFISDAMAQDPTPNITATPAPIGVIGRRRVRAGTYRRLADEIRELGRTGLDYTAKGRNILFGGREVDTAPLVRLTDGSFEAETILLDGQSVGTQFAILASSSATGGEPVVGLAGGLGRAGLVQRVDTESGILDEESADEAAQARLAIFGDPLEVPTGRLLEEAPVSMSELVPGARVEVAAKVGLRELVDTYRLLAVNVHASASESGVTETVTIAVEPLGTVEE